MMARKKVSDSHTLDHWQALQFFLRDSRRCWSRSRVSHFSMASCYKISQARFSFATLH